MKKKMIFVLAFALAACSSVDDELSEKKELVTLMFSPYEVTAITKAETSIATFCTHLDVWITDGTEMIDLHQSSTDAGFGSMSVTLDKTKTYTMYAVAHKCESDAALSDGVISFPDDKITHSMFYSTTFTPANTTSLSCLMTRIVAQFRIETTDAIPSELKKVQITIHNVFDRWNVTTGGTHSLDRTSTITISSTHADGTVALNVFAIVTEAQTLHTVTVTGLDADDNEVLSPRIFEDVPLRNGYRTTYRGALRDATLMGAFTVENDWMEYDVVNF